MHRFTVSPVQVVVQALLDTALQHAAMVLYYSPKVQPYWAMMQCHVHQSIHNHGPIGFELQLHDWYVVYLLWSEASHPASLAFRFTSYSPSVTNQGLPGNLTCTWCSAMDCFYKQ